MGSRIDEHFASLRPWGDEARALRAIVLDAGLEETWKWKQPCYVHADTNVAMISTFTRHASLSFFAGVLLDDPDGVLTTPGANSQSARQLRVVSVDDVERLEPEIRRLLRQAKRHAAAGTRVEFTAKDELELPVELAARFDDVEGLEAAFLALTPGRQRGFVLHIAGAKQAATRAKRVDGHLDRILAGKGIHDCVCGRSARMPRCDGSHSR